jgi:hypothetical protein
VGLVDEAFAAAGAFLSPDRTALILLTALPSDSTLLAVFSTAWTTFSTSAFPIACPICLYHLVLGALSVVEAAAAGAAADVLAGAAGFAAGFKAAGVAGF